MSLNTLKWAAILCFIVAMAVLLGGGISMRKELPPYPGRVVFLKTFRVIPDLIIICCGVLPLAYFLITTYPHLKAAEIKDDGSVWERLEIEL